MKSSPGKKLFAFDSLQSGQVPGLIAGVDEVGMGPLAGPVVAAAVIFNPSIQPFPVNDSKKLTPLERQKLFHKILEYASVGIGIVEPSLIDEINIYQAGRLAMRKAVLSLPRTPDFLLVDGRVTIDLPLPQKSIIKGDTQSASIAAASIIAKVYRDSLMELVDEQYPEYDFKGHKGYGTPSHLKRIREHGPCPIHRRSFMPVREALQNLL